MGSLTALAIVVLRAFRLLALALIPPLFSPEPVAPASPIPIALALLAVTAACVAVVARSRARLSREHRGALGLIVAAFAIALACAFVYQGDRAPLGRGVAFVAPPLWLGIGWLLSVVLRARVARPRLVAALATMLAAGLLFGSSRWLSSNVGMWLRAMDVDADNEVAIDVLTRGALHAKEYKAARAIADRCVEYHPNGAPCLELRAWLGFKTGGYAQALEDARAAVAASPDRLEAHAALAAALALHGEGAAGETEARKSLERGEAHGLLRYALALALDAQGKRRDAIAEAKRGASLGAGRDASLLAAALAIAIGQLDDAAAVLNTLVERDPSDGDAVYDMALIADRRDDYNGAREGYLRALAQNPNLADARYNLAMLTLRFGAGEEAKHHALKFVASYPNDPRCAEILRRTQANAP